MGHMSAMKKSDCWIFYFILFSVNLFSVYLQFISRLSIFACTYYLFYNFSYHTIKFWQITCGTILLPFCCGDLIGLALPAFSPSESSPVSETSTIVLLPLCLGRIFPMKTLFHGIFSQNISSSVQITDSLVSALNQYSKLYEHIDCGCIIIPAPRAIKQITCLFPSCFIPFPVFASST